MTLAFSTRGWGADATPARIVAHAQALGVRDVHLCAPIAHPVAARGELRVGGARVISVAAAAPADDGGFPEALAQAGVCASALSARAVVVAGGVVAGSSVAGSRSEAEREGAADRLVRTLHGPARAGVPLVLRNGAGTHDLLGFEELGWLLAEVSALGFWFDPLAAHLRHLAEAGPALQTWLDAYAGRVGGVFVHGGTGAGGSHPTDGGPDWGSLVQSLPRGVPWILDLDARLGVRDAADAVHWLRALRS